MCVCEGGGEKGVCEEGGGGEGRERERESQYATIDVSEN